MQDIYLGFLSHLFIPSPNEYCTSSCFFVLHTNLFSFSIHSLLPSEAPGSQNVRGLEGLTEGNKHLKDFHPSRPLLFPGMNGGWMHARNEATTRAGCPAITYREVTTPGQGTASPTQTVPSLQPCSRHTSCADHSPSQRGLGTSTPPHFCLKCPHSVIFSIKPFQPTFPPQNRVHSF